MNERELSDLKRRNVLLDTNNSVPLDQDTRIYLKRKYISKNQISELAESKGIKGITIHDIQKNNASIKSAQRQLKYFHDLRVLFTAQDLINQDIQLPPTFRNRRPQRYYAYSKKADLIEKIKKDYQNGLLNTTGMPNSNYPLYQSLQNQRANYFLEALQFLHFSPTYIHKINFMLSIGKDNYKEISNYLHRPMGKRQENIGKRHVEYDYHPNGTVQVFTTSNKHPVRLENEDDVNVFFSLIGQIKDRMIFHLEDRSERIIPPINNWILKQCDINNDIPISDKAQLYLPDIQLKFAGRVFRTYIKWLDNKLVNRIEESKEVNKPLSSFNDLWKPDLNMPQTIQKLSEKIDYLYHIQKHRQFNPYAFSIF